MTTFRVLVFAVIAALLLSACGQRGPLYLPNHKKTIPTQQKAQDETPIY